MTKRNQYEMIPEIDNYRDMLSVAEGSFPRRLVLWMFSCAFGFMALMVVLASAAGNVSGGLTRVSADANLVSLSNNYSDTTVLAMSRNDTFQWRNRPSSFSIKQDGSLSFIVPSHTDYWRWTYHGFIKNDGPFYYHKVTMNPSIDVEVVAKFSGDYATQFDQAGIMVWQSDTLWMKCGIEYTNGVQHASTVITRDYSDWSMLPLPSNPQSAWFKVKLMSQPSKESIEVFYSLDGETYTLIRQAYLTSDKSLDIGMFAAAPRGNGFPVVFEEFHILD